MKEGRKREGGREGGRDERKEEEVRKQNNETHLKMWKREKRRCY
jgi:hypothetical protein